MGTGHDKIIPIDILLAMARGELGEDEVFRLVIGDEKIEHDQRGNAKVEAAIRERDKQKLREQRQKLREQRKSARDARMEMLAEHEEDCTCRGCVRVIRHSLGRATSEEGILRNFGAEKPGPFNEEVAVREQVRKHPLD